MLVPYTNWNEFSAKARKVWERYQSAPRDYPHQGGMAIDRCKPACRIGTPQSAHGQITVSRAAEILNQPLAEVRSALNQWMEREQENEEAAADR